MKKFLIPFLLFSYSCSTGTVVSPPDNKTSEQQNINKENKFSGNEIAGLKFNQVSDQNVNLINNQKANSQNRNNAPQASPQNPSQASDSALINTPQPSLASGKSDIFGGYLNSQNPFEEYIMSDYQEAKTTGFNGSLLEGYTKIVKPIIKEWTSDAKATYIYGNLNQNGSLEASDNIYSPHPLQYTYVSPSKKEVYSILVSQKETLVLRQKWILKNFIDSNIKIDSQKAIQIYNDKVKDKNYNTEYDNNNLSQNSQPLYEIPNNSYWTFYLSQEKDYLIWNINLNYTYPTIAPVPNNQAYTNTWYSGGYAKINAQTGELLSMSRPVRYTETVQPDINTSPEYKLIN